MLRPVFSCLLLVAVLSTSNALAQQSRSKSAKKPAADTWGAEAAPAAAPAAVPAAAAAPAASSGFAAPAAGVEANPQSNGFAIAPGFTAAPSHRVRMDYRGRPLAPYIKRNVSNNTSTTAPAPMVEATAPAEPAVTTTEVAAPVAAPAATKSAAASASTTKKVSSAGAAPAAAAAPAPKKAPAKKAPAKKADDGWGSSGSGW